ncbi:MAG: tRNA (adenosine(37)-N6)-threonylcarbamoyltransferase complex dimerization subunit type 1 TsaB [Clostridia bacterium]|nr:tRNA (adenosine(37)-N6)-threonylcarbamoyltransferase complex dimerization subunit type 1 TsaB [Clostridia bacterium]
MITLGIDTTAVAASVALTKDGALLSEFYTNIGLQHSRTLMPMVESLLSCCNLTVQDVDRIAVAEGPGSFTGVRIGVAAAKGLALPNNTPCVGVSTLEALAYNLPVTEGVICPVMDARCQQVYNALFEYQNGILTRLCEDRAIAIADLQAELQALGKSVIWLGDGARLCYDALPDTTGHTLAPEQIRFQHASSVALLAERAEITVSAEQLAVSYLRPPQAVRALKEKE